MFRIHQIAARQHCPPTSRRHSTNSYDFSSSLSSYKQYNLNSNAICIVNHMSSSMKLLTIFLLLLTAIPLATTAAPLPGSPGLQIQPQQQQRPLAPPPTDSFSTSSDTESTSSESSRSSKFSLKNILKPAKTFSSTTFSSTKEFKCHSFPTTSILPDVSSYLTNLLRGYREIIYSGGSGNKGDGNLFKTCYAGYTADDVDPAIYFGNLAKKQVVVVEKLLRNQVMGKWEGARIVKSGDTIALVMGNGTKGLKRRNTV